MEFEFKLTYKLPGNEPDTEKLINKLGEAGCTDALVGLGVAGQVGLEFIRQAPTSEEAILSAMEAVKLALPDAWLIDAKPGFVERSDVLHRS